MSEPDLVRRAILLAMAAAPIAAASSSCFAAGEALPTGKVTDFDFLRGHWKVRHQTFIQERWQEFEGELSSRPLLAGQVNVDDNVWQWNGTTRRALAVRVFDPKTSRWSIFWLDARFPEAFGPPVVGGFSGHAGTFFGDDQLNGKRIGVRFNWLVESPRLARWEQAYSYDNGQTWEPNWRMRFERLA